MVLYLLLLFGIAQYAVRRGLEGRSIVQNPYVYALSLCVYVSAWTYYGSIGRAATTGLEFLPIYIGPVLAMTLGWVLIRKMIRVSKEYRLCSISDFISYRYGSSYVIGALVAVLSLVMVTPYVALQLIAISISLDVLSGHTLLFGVDGTRRLIVALLLGVFAVIFGARHMDPMEHHEGLILVVAFESVVKLAAFLLVGVYVVYGMFGGYHVILDQISQAPQYLELTDVDFTLWFSLTLISFFAVLLLPRQFHVTVVENAEEKQLKKAMWLFPLYMLLINLFVPAIAFAGVLLKTPGLADAYVISIPESHGQNLLAGLVFIGGFSAATAMIMVESVAVGGMMLNNLELPYLLRKIGKGKNLPATLINMKRLNILLVVMLGYLYSRLVAYDILASIGIVSFLAVSQLAPAALGGLYWKKGNRLGAVAGLVSGLFLWIYTALIPALASEGSWLYEGLVKNGPAGLTVFKPTALLGSQLDIWTHSLFWSLLVNASLFVLVSLLYKPSPEEEAQAEAFVDIYQGKSLKPAKMSIAQMGTVAELESTLALYVGQDRATFLVDAELARLGTDRETIDGKQLLELWNAFERVLTGSVGSSTTRMIVEDSVPVRPVVEAAVATEATYDLPPGHIFIVPEKGYEVFTDQITHGVEGLCVTHLDPDEVRSRWGFKETPIIVLGRERGKDHYISPTNLPLLFMTLKSFVESSKNSLVLLDNIEMLVKANQTLVPEKEVLDFVYEIELLARKSRLVLAERHEFVHIDLKGEIAEARELIFTLGPLSYYLFSVFSQTMLSRLDEAVKRDVIDEANDLISAGGFFEEAGQKRPSDESPEASCEPDMRDAVRSPSPNLRVDASIVLSRRAFFVAIRRLARIIKKHDQEFDLGASVANLMKSYGRSRYEVLLVPGTTYVVEETKPSKSMELYAELVNHGMDGLCISRYNPDTLFERYGISQKTVIWLTQKSEPGFRTVDPTNFPRLSSMISEFLSRANYPVILLEGLGYLITQSNYETVLRFIQSQRDEIAIKDAIMLVHIDPLSLDTKELHRLKSELEPFEV
ncbi:MAG: DUF835 domain-containing protein [Methanotrichaceae archaeon]|nr:DUF835 domain-containing protein [Methanotrichaceae archaeon]